MNVYVNKRAKGNPMKAAREGSHSFTSKDLQAERVPEVIGRPGVFRDRDKLGRSRVCCDVRVTNSNRKFQ